MASNNAYGPQIVTEGMVCCLDANAAKSYPGAGTSWHDLSGHGAATMVNSPVFESSPAIAVPVPTFSFDSTNDSWSLSSLTGNPVAMTGDITLFGWFQ